MPKMIVATDKFPYGKITYRKGAEVDMEDRYAELFLKTGKLKWPEGASPNASDLPEEVMQRSSRREPVTEVEEAEVATKVLKAEAVKEDEAPKPQTYMHRAMVAETPKKRGRPGRPKKSQS